MADNPVIIQIPDQSVISRTLRSVMPIGHSADGVDEPRAIGALAGRMDIITWVSCLLLSLLGLGFAKVAHLPAVQWSPWIIGIFFLVLPHGGVDDAVPSLLHGEGLWRRSGLGFYTWYLGLFGLVLLTWVMSADLGLLTFLVFSAYHFGQGDLYWSSIGRVIGSGGEGDLLSRVLLLACRGGVSVFLPFIYHDQQFLWIAERLSEQSGQALTMARWVSEHRAGLLAGLGLLVSLQVVSSLGRYWRGRHNGHLGRELLETAILIVFMIATPPILSVGAYLLCWHAPRHILRLMLLDPEQRRDLVGGQGWRALREFHRRSLALVIAAVVLLVLISAYWLRYDLLPERLILPAFLFINAITIPHIVTVTVLDRFQQIWKRGKH